MLPSERKVGLAVDAGRPLLRSQQMIEEKLVQRVNLLASAGLSVSFIAAVDNLQWLTLAALNFSGSHLNFHVALGKTVHGRRDGSAARASCSLRVSTLDALIVGVGAILVLILESRLELRHEAGMAFHVSQQVQFHN